MSGASGSGSIPQLWQIIAGWRSGLSRRSHNPQIAGSNPAPATNTPQQKDLDMTNVSTEAMHILNERMCAKINDGRSVAAEDVAEMLDAIKCLRQQNTNLIEMTQQGGPAFPPSITGMADQEGPDGMSLLDYLAAQTRIAIGTWTPDHGVTENKAEVRAAYCYNEARAMLKVRAV